MEGHLNRTSGGMHHNPTTKLIRSIEGLGPREDCPHMFYPAFAIVDSSGD
jgi:hypothetical protein